MTGPTSEAAPAAGRVLRLEIAERRQPTFERQEFGAAGAYESLEGSAYCDLDPLHPSNREIVNLDRAPRNAEGRVAYRVDIAIIKPIDLARGNGWLFYEFPNRGTKRAIQRINSGPPTNRPALKADIGNGYLMRQGHTLVWSGWQGDLVRDQTGRMTADFPVATDAGRPLTATCREEFMLDAPGLVREDINAPIIELSDEMFVAPLHYPAVALDPGGASLTVRARERDARKTPPGLAWRFVDPLHVEVTRPPGFDRGAIYEFIYAARDPIVMGMGLASVRDIVSFLRYATQDAAGNPNPLAPQGRPALQRALGFGLSQSGRVLREFLHAGFNADAAGRPVFDAALPVVTGARRSVLNSAFVQATRFSRQHEDHAYPGDQFPFTYPTLADPLSGRTDGILARAEAANVSPKVMHVDTDSEVWSGRASLVVTDCAGNDIAMPDNVRVYLAGGLPHGPFRLAEAVACYPPNLLAYHVILRALILAMIEWIERGVEPPASRFPSRAAGTLVSVDEARARFPAVPGIAFPAGMNELRVMDHSRQPPAEGERYPTFVVPTDRDGNPATPALHPLMLAPTGTHLGWQLRRAGYAEGALYNLFGAFVPFAATAAERRRTGDPRPSLEERYGTRDAWSALLAERMTALVEARLLLQEDADRVVEASRASWDIFGAV